MKNYYNIEKSGFRSGEYIGSASGKVYRITKSTSSYGNWYAENLQDYNDQIFAFGLDNMSKALQARETK